MIQLINIVLGLSAFLLFAFLQGLAINGFKAATEEGNIFEAYGKWARGLGFWGKSLGGCIRCMSSVFGAITFWPPVLLVYGFHSWELLLFVADVFILVSINWYLYKNL